MGKPSSINLKFIRVGPTWEVVALTNIDSLNPGDHINEAYKNRFVADPDCTVSIVAPDYLAWLKYLPIPFLGGAPLAAKEPAALEK